MRKTNNRNLHKAKNEKNDEFYTQLSDIANELKHYREHFRDKIVFLNCDDPEKSEFWRYFSLNFEFLGLKKLISTHFERDKPSYKLEIYKDINGDGKINEKDMIKTSLKQNGDFRSSESIELLKECDIVVTNPPFSLFREYIAQLMEYDKKFLVVGNMGSVSYREIFPLIKANKICLGVSPRSMNFVRPENSEDYSKIVDGNKIKTVNACWFTNMDYPKRHEVFIGYKTYKDNETDYPKYDNYDAIEISKAKDIPTDYYEKMGVPVTFLSVYNPNEFELLSNSSYSSKDHFGIGAMYVDGKKKYTRIIIKRRR
jgi:hypothetical protein